MNSNVVSLANLQNQTLLLPAPEYTRIPRLEDAKSQEQQEEQQQSQQSSQTIPSSVKIIENVTRQSEQQAQSDDTVAKVVNDVAS